MSRSVEILSRGDIIEEVKDAVRKETDWILRELKRLRVRIIEVENLVERKQRRDII